MDLTCVPYYSTHMKLKINLLQKQMKKKEFKKMEHSYMQSPKERQKANFQVEKLFLLTLTKILSLTTLLSGSSEPSSQPGPVLASISEFQQEFC